MLRIRPCGRRCRGRSADHGRPCSPNASQTAVVLAATYAGALFALWAPTWRLTEQAVFGEVAAYYGQSGGRDLDDDQCGHQCRLAAERAAAPVRHGRRLIGAGADRDVHHEDVAEVAVLMRCLRKYADWYRMGEIKRHRENDQ